MTQFIRHARATALALALATPAIASAQAAPDAWQFGVSLYGYFPTISGNSNFPASGNTPSVSVDVDRILDNLEFVFMGTLEARKGRWGGFTDVVYMNVGNDRSGSRDIAIGGIEIPGTASADFSYDLKGLIWTIAGEYNVHASREASVGEGRSLAAGTSGRETPASMGGGGGGGGGVCRQQRKLSSQVCGSPGS